ncbi:hypothetical protein K491DRAFT_684495 [Lophiostoma macrostomum CBS 122681]|uniref:Vacuolar ATPase assembly protein VMA22 n=1 Tax=Lophiostoma macrostomum CBS 122681 TaxID=1314788 RepID=A0A6A6SLA1_9PLEO|nr:hypothetical protein K491DRAFT_684495 [Lophiostoma macrostomum CBS 122681]
MAQVEAQRAAEPQFDSTSKAALLLRLDELLEQYLVTLDIYEKARHELAASLSSHRPISTISPALVTGETTLTTECRHREKLVDEPSVTFSVAPSSPAPKPLGSEPQNEPEATEATIEPDLPESAPPVQPGAGNETSPDNKHAPKDPIRWFGILVPPALRSAQSSFISAVEGPVPNLAALTKDLRRQEIDVARLRKQIRKL